MLIIQFKYTTRMPPARKIRGNFIKEFFGQGEENTRFQQFLNGKINVGIAPRYGGDNYQLILDIDSTSRNWLKSYNVMIYNKIQIIAKKCFGHNAYSIEKTPSGFHIVVHYNFKVSPSALKTIRGEFLTTVKDIKWNNFKWDVVSSLRESVMTRIGVSDKGTFTYYPIIGNNAMTSKNRDEIPKYIYSENVWKKYIKEYLLLTPETASRGKNIMIKYLWRFFNEMVLNFGGE